MGYTRLQLREILQVNLAEAGLNTGYYSDSELNDSIQDAYNEVVAKSYCLVKSTTLNFVANTNYYDFISLGVSDFMGTIAIFNNLTNWWLRDDLTLRDADRIRRDWETWYGSAQFWTPHSLKYTIILPKQLIAIGTFKLIYWAMAPTLASDSDTFLIADDANTLLEQYCTADMLETAEEPSKAMTWWTHYFNSLEQYKARCRNQAGADLLLRV